MDRWFPLKLASLEAHFTAIVFSHGTLLCQRSICAAMISWSPERQTVSVTSFHISTNYVTTFFFFCQFLDCVSIIDDGDVPFQTAVLMAAMPHGIDFNCSKHLM